MTERMVSVPVEPTPEMTMAGAGCLPAVDGVFGLAGALSANVYRAMLTAAPVREEGGAGPGGYLVKDFADGWYWTPNAALDHAGGAPVWSVADSRYETEPPALATREEAPAEMFGVTGAVDETEALAVALFAVRCPGVRMTDEDLHFYKSAARSAMQVVSAELSGNPGQLEAPSEAGEPSLVDWFSRFVETYQEGCGPDTDALIACLDRVRDSYRAQPQAREEAQPVHCHHEAYQGYCAHCGVKIVNGFAMTPPTPPAPEAEKLRRAMLKACDILAERTQGHAARSPAHNARLVLEHALKQEALR